MKTTKRRFEQFLFYDYTGIEAHLEKMAMKGWQIQYYLKRRKRKSPMIRVTKLLFSN